MINPSARPSAVVGTLYRHGDVLLKAIAKLPPGLTSTDSAVLAHGEATGHSHRIQQTDRVQLWQRGNQLFLEVKADSASLIHQEHHTIELPQGIYHVWKQREYRPDAYVDVAD